MDDGKAPLRSPVALVMGLCWLSVCLVSGIRFEHATGFVVAALVVMVTFVVGMIALTAFLRRPL
ncbi:hypothetical protein [Arsenicicoccus bolidensis]|uniref:hypothetical protein n=1 Tax=Arsenicicoccus bolidensis TaxID=229480 RepID=UPI0004922D93|nr:hypothetical protein [Arsenicicoccus bolidensis]